MKGQERGHRLARETDIFAHDRGKFNEPHAPPHDVPNDLHDHASLCTIALENVSWTKGRRTSTGQQIRATIPHFLLRDSDAHGLPAKNGERTSSSQPRIYKRVFVCHPQDPVQNPLLSRSL